MCVCVFVIIAQAKKRDAQLFFVIDLLCFPSVSFPPVPRAPIISPTVFCLQGCAQDCVHLRSRQFAVFVEHLRLPPCKALERANLDVLFAFEASLDDSTPVRATFVVGHTHTHTHTTHPHPPTYPPTHPHTQL
jgi:hypothetical protein